MVLIVTQNLKILQYHKLNKIDYFAFKKIFIIDFIEW